MRRNELFMSLPRELYKRPALLLLFCMLMGMFFYEQMGLVLSVSLVVACSIFILTVVTSGGATNCCLPGFTRFDTLKRSIIPCLLICWGILPPALASRYYWREIPEHTNAHLTVEIHSDGIITTGKKSKRYEVKLLEAADKSVSVLSGKKMILYGAVDSDYHPGMQLHITHAKIKDTKHIQEDNPKYGKWLRGGLIAAVIYPSYCSRTDSLRQRTTLSRITSGYRVEWLKQLENTSLTSRQKALVSIMTLGYRGREETQSLRQSFNDIGVAHLLAVSGFHLAVVVELLGMLFLCAAVICPLPRLRWVLILLAAWGYVGITGCSMPTLRAALMLTVYGCGKLLMRKPDTLNSLAVSALILLAFNPFAWLDVSFQLSFVAVFSIVIFKPRIDKLFGVVRQPIFRYVRDLITVCLAAQVMLLPLCSYHFGQVSFLFLWSNIPMVFVGSMLIPLSLLGMGLGWMGIPPVLWDWMCRWPAEIMLRIADGLGRLPLPALNLYWSLSAVLFCWLVCVWCAVVCLPRKIHTTF